MACATNSATANADGDCYEIDSCHYDVYCHQEIDENGGTYVRSDGMVVTMMLMVMKVDMMAMVMVMVVMMMSMVMMTMMI